MSRGRLLDPGLAVVKKGLAVHQHRADARQCAAEPIEDREPVGVDVAPVVDVAIPDPPGLGEQLRGLVAGAEDDQGTPDLREGQVVDLVLGDEHRLDVGHLQCGE